jgi:hypothetical protein
MVHPYLNGLVCESRRGWSGWSRRIYTSAGAELRIRHESWSGVSGEYTGQVLTAALTVSQLERFETAHADAQAADVDITAAMQTVLNDIDLDAPRFLCRGRVQH